MGIESKTAKAILQSGEDFEICGRKYTITAPTPATLIMVSEYISQMPIMAGERIVQEVLIKAKDTKPLGKAAATLILGAKRINAHHTIKSGFLGLKRQKEIDWLAEKLLEEYTINELSVLLGRRLEQMQIGDFFGLTTSLVGANMTKATKEVETVHGE